MDPIRPSKSTALFENNNNNDNDNNNDSNSVLPIWFRNFTSGHSIFSLLSQTSSSFAERTLSKSVPAQPPLPISSSSTPPSVLSLSSFLSTDPVMSAIPFPITLIRGDKLQTVNLRLQLSSNETGMI